MINILIVEDDPVIARGLQVNLEMEDYSVKRVSNLASAKQHYESEKLDLVLLDLGLPDGSGFDFLSSVRNSGSVLPIIVLTAKTDEDSVVEGLQRGANDFVKKPFGNRELLARIKAVLKIPQRREQTIRYGDLVMSVDQRTVSFEDKPFDLNRREFDILKHLLERAEAIVTRDNLLQTINKDGEIFDRTIDSHISHLRAKLRQGAADTIKISSVYGVGYRLEKA
jgi:DNA-binding response OmpR family regulator